MEVKIIDGCAIYEVPFKSLSKETSHKCKQKILNLYLSTKTTNLILNMEKVQDIDANGLEVLIFAGSLIQEAKGKISLYGLTSNVKKILMQSRMYRFFDINRTEEESLEFIKDVELSQLYEYRNLKKTLKSQSA